MSQQASKYCLNRKILSLAELRNMSRSAVSEERQIAQAILDWHHNNEFCFETSGSTGKPKKIKFSKKQVIASIELSQKTFDLSRKDTALLCLPVRYVAGRLMLFRALHIGMNIVTAEPKINIALASRHSVSFAAFVPAQVEAIVASEKGREWLERIKTVLVGGAPINNTLEEKLSLFSNKTYHTYGMTETLTHIALRQLSNGGVPYFKPLHEIEISVSDDDTLCINASHLDALVVTNDLVKINKDDSFEILGRKDNVINSGGLKIVPEKLEKTLKGYVNVDLAIVGVDDDRFGRKAILIVEGDKEKNEWQINDGLRSIEKNKRPKEIFFLEKFPRTESGKLKRSELVKLIYGQF